MTLQTSLRSFFMGFIAFASFTTIQAQAPQVINYQAVVRDAVGEIVKNRAVNFRLSILDGGISGSPQYIETQNKTTNQFGLVTFGIGQGSTVSGSMSAVTWATGNKFLKVELDINGGNTFSLMSTSQFLSVPYALYAANSGTSPVTGWGLSGNTTNASNYLGTLNAQDLRLFTNGAQKAVLTTYGYLGLGTPAPLSPLSIETNADGFSNEGPGDGRVAIDIKNTSTSSASQTLIKLAAGSGGNITMLSNVSSSYTISPDSDCGILWSTGTGGLVLKASPKTSSDPDVSSIRFQTGFVPVANGSQERMRLDRFGNLGIGTTAPKAKLEIATGDVYVSDATKGIILKAPNGTCWRVTMDNTGNFVRTSITCPN